MAAPLGCLSVLSGACLRRICFTQGLQMVLRRPAQYLEVFRQGTLSKLLCTATLKVPSANEPDILYKRLEIEVKGHDTSVINSYEKFVTLAAKELDINLEEVTTPPRIIERRTLLKSVHIFKKHRVQYEWRTHFRTFKIRSITGSTADTFLEYIQRNLPEGMAMKATKTRLEKLPAHIKPPPSPESS